jgi:hypothetical protein
MEKSFFKRQESRIIFKFWSISMLLDPDPHSQCPDPGQPNKCGSMPILIHYTGKEDSTVPYRTLQYRAQVSFVNLNDPDNIFFRDPEPFPHFFINKNLQNMLLKSAEYAAKRSACIYCRW